MKNKTKKRVRALIYTKHERRTEINDNYTINSYGYYAEGEIFFLIKTAKPNRNKK